MAVNRHKLSVSTASDESMAGVSIELSCDKFRNTLNTALSVADQY